MWQPTTLAPEGPVRAKKLHHYIGTPDMFYAAQGLGTATANTSYCSGAAAEAGNCAAEAHIAPIIAHSFNRFNASFVLAKAERNSLRKSLDALFLTRIRRSPHVVADQPDCQ